MLNIFKNKRGAVRGGALGYMRIRKKGVFAVIPRIFRIKRKQQQPTISIGARQSVHVKKYKQRSFYTRTLPILIKLAIAGIILAILGIFLLFLLDTAFYIKTKKSFGAINFVKKYLEKKNDKNVTLSYVKGLEKYKIPAYPGSSFVFNNKDTFLSEKDWSEIQLFLLHGNSVYLLPNRQTFNEIKSKYRQLIEKAGFKFLSEKPITDENGFAGLYFINEKQKVGLRVYTITGTDIWYEIITLAQAKNQLKDRIVNIISKQHALTSDSNKLPKEYKMYLSLPDKYTYEGFKLPDMGAYLVRIYDNNKKLVMKIIPYKKAFLPLQTSQLKKYALEYIKDTGVILDLNVGYKTGYAQVPDFFEKQEKNVFLLDFLNSVEDSYKLGKWFYVKYTDINQKTTTIFAVQKNNILWVVQVE